MDTGHDPVAITSLPLSASELSARREGLRRAAQLAPVVPLNPHSQLLMKAAEQAGYQADFVPAVSFTDNVEAPLGLKLRIGTRTFFHYRQFLYWSSPSGRLGPLVNGSSTELLRRKHHTKQVLAAAGIPVPQGALFTNHQLAAALSFAAEMPGEICVKPNSGSDGIMVYPRLRTFQDVANTVTLVCRNWPEFVIEESLDGEAWRFFYVRPQIVGIKLGRPASVVGDGNNTVRALTAEWNQRRHHRKVPGHTSPLDPIRLEYMLRYQGLTLDDVPANGRRIFLNPCSNGSQGADTLWRPGTLHQDHLAWMIRGFEAFPDLMIGASDVIIRDPASPPDADNFHVIEINSGPSLLPYSNPWEGPMQDVCGPIIALLAQLSPPHAIQEAMPSA